MEPLLGVKEYQEAAKEGKIIGYECYQCGSTHVEVIVFCPKCGSDRLRGREFKGEGTIVTYTVQQVAPKPFSENVPYAWAIIRLDEGPTVTGRIESKDELGKINVGHRVRLGKPSQTGYSFVPIH